MAVKRHSYNGKHLIGTGLQCQRFGPLLSWWKAWQQASRLGAGGVKNSMSWSAGSRKGLASSGRVPSILGQNPTPQSSSLLSTRQYFLIGQAVGQALSTWVSGGQIYSNYQNGFSWLQVPFCDRYWSLWAFPQRLGKSNCLLKPYMQPVSADGQDQKYCWCILEQACFLTDQFFGRQDLVNARTTSLILNRVKDSLLWSHFEWLWTRNRLRLLWILWSKMKAISCSFIVLQNKDSHKLRHI